MRGTAKFLFPLTHAQSEVLITYLEGNLNRHKRRRDSFWHQVITITEGKGSFWEAMMKTIEQTCCHLDIVLQCHGPHRCHKPFQLLLKFQTCHQSILHDHAAKTAQFPSQGQCLQGHLFAAHQGFCYHFAHLKRSKKKKVYTSILIFQAI